MRAIFDHIKWQVVILAIFYAASAALTLFLLTRQSQSDWEECHGVSATLGAISGPFTGAVARPNEAGCWRVSRQLFPGCAVALGASVFFQLFPVPRPFRLIIWSLGLIAWFGGGFCSVLTAV